MKRSKHLKITLTEEEYGQIKKAAGYEPMASYARRAIINGFVGQCDPPIVRNDAQKANPR